MIFMLRPISSTPETVMIRTVSSSMISGILGDFSSVRVMRWVKAGLVIGRRPPPERLLRPPPLRGRLLWSLRLEELVAPPGRWVRALEPLLLCAPAGRCEDMPAVAVVLRPVTLAEAPWVRLR